MALLLKVFAVVLKVEKRGYWQCYIAIFLSFCGLSPFVVYGLVENQFLLFAIKFFIFGLAVVLVLEAAFWKAAIVAVIFSLLVSISVTHKSAPVGDKQARYSVTPNPAFNTDLRVAARPSAG
jgi:hypothetical protein